MMNLLAIIIFISVPWTSSSYLNKNKDNVIYNTEGDVKIGLLIGECENVTEKAHFTQTLITSAIWTTERLNFLEHTAPLRLGLTIFNANDENDYYNSIFKLFQEREEHLLLGIVSTTKLPDKIQTFCDILDIKSKFTVKYWAPFVKLTVRLLSALSWNENITVIAPSDDVLQEFFRYTRRKWMCVKHHLVYEKNSTIILKNTNGPVVIFGDKMHINLFLGNLFYEETYETDIIFVPLDDSYLQDLPEGSYVIQPPYLTDVDSLENPRNIIPTPILFEIANPILYYTNNITNFIHENCNETEYKMNCCRSMYGKMSHGNDLLPPTIINSLKIEPLVHKFTYNIFKVENNTNAKTLVKVFTYDIFDDVLLNMEGLKMDSDLNHTTPKQICPKPFEECISRCINFKKGTVTKSFIIPMISADVRLRPESWVFSFLALSVLGVLFCISVFIFLFVKLFKKEVLEGNPVLSIVLLLVVLLMYCSVVPFALEGTKTAREPICLARSLSITSSFAGAFALVLSRSILLATVSKEVGFMSHVAGPVQSFLCLFIFGVQAALNLQVVSHCEDIFRGYSFIYLLSYNVMLLILLICICPLIMKSQRNYREGKYFTVATLMIGCVWSCWLPGYALLDEDWKDPLLCLGLVSTASILLGCIFIPRTYLMTIATARDRITSALPSLATATSAIDIYRASTQPVYDCVNVAAINAANVARATAAMPTTDQSNFYSCPTLPEDGDDFDVHRCDTPITPDKITRF